GDDRERLEQIASKEGVRDRVLFVGNVSQDELHKYYESCDIFVLPSIGEGFGIVFLEAMYHKKPCVGVKATAVPEVISDGKTGVLCNVDDKVALEESIIKLLKDDNIRSSYGMAGFEKLQKEFTFDDFQKKLEEIICH
ncbi:MAG: glycosyltransferase family 4 protein, partial [Candidatus Melainabacteria bacterium]|nr:glycosyltransferase family 4 protein [Candidatus Melainabacteria bacterium]